MTASGVLIPWVEVADAFGKPRDYVRGWIKNARHGLRLADPGGNGRGNTGRMSVPQAIGFGAAVAVFDSDRGCRFSYVSRVYAAFGATRLDAIEGELASGDVWFTGLAGKRGVTLVNDPNLPDSVNLCPIHATVMKLASKYL